MAASASYRALQGLRTMAMACRRPVQQHVQQRLIKRGASAVTFTRERQKYSHIERGDFGTVGAAEIEAFEAMLPGRVLKDEDEMVSYTEDWLGQYRGPGSVVLKPKTTEEASEILKFCHANTLAVNLQGGNTGLVGGSVPLHDEVIISTSLMNNVISFDDISGILMCEAGCILEVLDRYLEDRGFIMPLDLGAKGTCQIGGNVSTNAGGVRLLRYGSLHGTVLGLEAVLADGTVVNTLSGCRKDNTGYDLKQMFIGAEGSLGLITKVSIQAPPRPQAVNVAFLGANTYEDVLNIFKASKRSLGEILSACEFLDLESMQLTSENLGLTCPLGDYPFYVLLETHGSNDGHDEEKLQACLEDGMEQGFIADGTIAQDRTQVNDLWLIRESITSALKEDGEVYKYDVSLPLPQLYELVETMRERTEGLAVHCCGYGHLGDGNLHLNITSKEYDEDLLAIIEPYVYDFTAGVGGSISAEHGLGLMKVNHIHYSKSPEAVAVMRQIKSALDPKGILNPYKTVCAN